MTANPTERQMLTRLRDNIKRADKNLHRIQVPVNVPPTSKLLFYKLNYIYKNVNSVHVFFLLILIWIQFCIKKTPCVMFESWQMDQSLYLLKSDIIVYIYIDNCGCLLFIRGTGETGLRLLLLKLKPQCSKQIVCFYAR